MESSKIRDYAPVLIEHSVRERLREAGYEDARTTVEPADSTPSDGNMRAGEVPLETSFNARVTLLNGGLGGGIS